MGGRRRAAQAASACLGLLVLAGCSTARREVALPVDAPEAQAADCGEYGVDLLLPREVAPRQPFTTVVRGAPEGTVVAWSLQPLDGAAPPVAPAGTEVRVDDDGARAELAVPSSGPWVVLWGVRREDGSALCAGSSRYVDADRRHRELRSEGRSGGRRPGPPPVAVL